MKATPHTHPVTVRRKYSHCEAGKQGSWMICYGDTEVYLNRLGRFWIDHEDSLPSDHRIARQIARAIAKHDEGSREAPNTNERWREAQARVTALAPLREADGEWGAEGVAHDR